MLQYRVYFLLITMEIVSGQDYLLTCPRPVKQKLRSGRWGRMQEEWVRKWVPCEMGGGEGKGEGVGWCGIPGDKYPWPSMRRFVSENTGLMRRMYGEVRQLNLMRMEFSDTNAIDDYDHDPRSLEVTTKTQTTTEAVATDVTEQQSQEETTVVTEVYFGDVVEKRSEVFEKEEEERVEKVVKRAVNACPVREEVVAPYWANNTRGEILALLNLNPFEQYVHWEKCNHEHKQMYCREGCRCEQQYRLHRLLAFDPTNECRGIFSDWFRFPSCCVCKCYLTEEEIATHLYRENKVEKIQRSPRRWEKEEEEFDDFDEPDVSGVDGRFFYANEGVFPR